MEGANSIGGPELKTPLQIGQMEFVLAFQVSQVDDFPGCCFQFVCRIQPLQSPGTGLEYVTHHLRLENEERAILALLSHMRPGQQP